MHRKLLFIFAVLVPLLAVGGAATYYFTDYGEDGSGPGGGVGSAVTSTPQAIGIGKDSPVAETATTRSEFIAAADQQCDDANRRIFDGVSYSSDPQMVLDRAASELQAFRLSAQSHPSEAAKLVSAADDLAHSRGADLELAAKALRNGSPQEAAGYIGRSNDTYQAFRNLVKGYGFQVCGAGEEGIGQPAQTAQQPSAEAGLAQQSVPQQPAQPAAPQQQAGAPLVTCVMIFTRRICTQYQRPTGQYRPLYGSNPQVQQYYPSVAKDPIRNPNIVHPR